MDLALACQLPSLDCHCTPRTVRNWQAVHMTNALPTMSVKDVCADTKDVWPIHREAPAFDEQSVEQEILVTGIKVRLARLTDRLGRTAGPSEQQDASKARCCDHKSSCAHQRESAGSLLSGEAWLWVYPGLMAPWALCAQSCCHPRAPSLTQGPEKHSQPSHDLISEVEQALYPTHLAGCRSDSSCSLRHIH